MDEALARRSAAFVEILSIPAAAEGPLSGATFAVKDVFDLAGRRTGGGHPRWRDSHPPALANALAVDLLLAAGAAGVGVAVTDELAASFAGENPFDGVPVNAAAPGHSAGGSSCGSAAAVAHGLCDFALGTDTGGSVRVPASNCGILGFRPTFGRVATCGVMPLSPSFDTVGLLARDPAVLDVAGRVLLGDAAPAAPLERILCLDDAFALAQPDVREALLPALRTMSQRIEVLHLGLGELVGIELPLETWGAVFSIIESAEIRVALGPWLASERPQLGPVVGRNLHGIEDPVDPELLERCWRLRGAFAQALRARLPAGTALCIPSVTTPAPLRGALEDPEVSSAYAVPLLTLCSLAGLAGAPQVSLPLGTADNLPVGLSLMAGPGLDTTLLHAALRFVRDVAPA